MKIKHIVITASIVSAVMIGFLKMQPPQQPRPLLIKHKNKAFQVLIGWEQAELRPSLLAFRNSCKLFLKQHPEHSVGSQHIALKAKDWQPACRAAQRLDSSSAEHIRDFFQTWFKPVSFTGKQAKQSLFTGYYAPSVKGSRQKSTQFTYPIYAVPSKSTHKNTVLAWVGSRKDHRTLVTEGSAIIELDNGSTLPVEYIKGHSLHAYFRVTPDHQFHGAQDVLLSPGYSLAIDRQWVPLGTPLWLTTTVRQDFSKKPQPFRRLMIAQDIGSAIRGAVRGDVYLGEGKQATKVGSNIRNHGQYWLLLPKTVKTKV